jgi:hypothetical protein
MAGSSSNGKQVMKLTEVWGRWKGRRQMAEFGFRLHVGAKLPAQKPGGRYKSKVMEVL